MPGWFGFVVGPFELSAGIMLAVSGWRSYGMALGAINMLGALLVLIRNGEGRHALLPALILRLIATAALLTWSAI